MTTTMPGWLQKVGVAAYWLSWPGLWLYVHSTQRTRVLVVCGPRVLLVKAWLGDGRWSLPGGGLHKHEAARRGAARELLEETSLSLSADSLQFIDHRHGHNHGLTFDYDLFVIEVAAPLPVKRQAREIVAIGWYDHRQLSAEQLTTDASAALHNWFQPTKQTL